MGLTSVLARSERAHRGCQGFTLVEVIIASLVVSVVACGTMMAFTAAANMTGSYSYSMSTSRTQDLPTLGEASDLAQKTIESFRSEVDTSSNVLATKASTGSWYCDTPPAGGTASQLGSGVARRYKVFQADCDGNGTVGDCFGVQSQVCWNGASCPCN